MITLFALVCIAVVVGVLVFEIWMFIDAIRNPRLTDMQRVLWYLGMLVFNPLTAAVYYTVASTRRSL